MKNKNFNELQEIMLLFIFQVSLLAFSLEVDLSPFLHMHSYILTHVHMHKYTLIWIARSHLHDHLCLPQVYAQ